MNAILRNHQSPVLGSIQRYNLLTKFRTRLALYIWISAGLIVSRTDDAVWEALITFGSQSQWYDVQMLAVEVQHEVGRTI